jgi:hypothetical protein
MSIRGGGVVEWVSCVRFTAAILTVSVGVLAMDHLAEPVLAWETAATVALGGRQVSLSKPVLVTRSKDYCWFPNMTRLANNDLFAVLQKSEDTATCNARSADAIWSGDGGITWTQPTTLALPARGDAYVESMMRSANDSTLLYPYSMYLNDTGNALVGSYQVVSGQPGTRQVTMVENGLTVTGWPRTVATNASFQDPRGDFGFNGQTMRLPNGDYLATLYGHFTDSSSWNLVLAESHDGASWNIRSTIASSANESAILRLKDNRLMCIFRRSSLNPYGQTFSSDDGLTWSTPTPMNNVFSVDPRVEMMADGTLALAGGRPGLDLWLNFDGTGMNWDPIDIRTIHNAEVPNEQITLDYKANATTTSYMKVQPLDDSHLLLMYDRVPCGWDPIPAGSTETNSIWAMQVTILPEPSALMLMTAAGVAGLLACVWRIPRSER